MKTAISKTFAEKATLKTMETNIAFIRFLKVRTIFRSSNAIEKAARRREEVVNSPPLKTKPRLFFLAFVMIIDKHLGIRIPLQVQNEIFLAFL